MKRHTPFFLAREFHSDEPENRSGGGGSDVAQICNLSVSGEIVASRDDFSERGCVRGTSRSSLEVRTRCGWVFDHSRAPLWLRLGRAAPASSRRAARRNPP